MIVSYYGAKDALSCAAKELSALGYKVVFYPLFQYMHDSNDKKVNWLQHFNQFTKTEAPKIMLWWYMGMPANAMNHFVDMHEHIVHVLFNWDDPFTWTDPESDLKEKAGLFDIALPTCAASCELYLQAGARQSVPAMPGYSPLCHHPVPENEIPERFKCDVAMCITNLYQDPERYPDQIMNRKILCDALYADRDIVFHIYGPEFLEEIYPEAYQGWATYQETKLVFSGSKINICTHVTGNRRGYLNERAILILGSGGLLMMDPVCGAEEILEDGKHCVMIDKADPIGHVNRVLHDIGRYDHIRTAGHALATSSFQWKHWANVLHKQICLYLFDAEYYRRKVGDEKLTGWAPRDHWLQVNPDMLPFAIDVPEDFDWVQYKKSNFKTGAPFDNKEDAWIHWKTTGQREGYIICLQGDRDCSDDGGPDAAKKKAPSPPSGA